LAGPELEGRANGKPGGIRAAAEIEKAFREMKLKPAGEDGYRQAIPVGSNVLGVIEGHHPKKRHEVVVLGAHYDHLGVLEGQLYAGADDNASSVAIVLEWLRRQHARGWKPDRTVLVAAFDAEEPPDFRTQDMGSQVFMNKPTVDRKRIQAMVCLDLMGGDLWEGYRSPLFVMGLETFVTSPLASHSQLQDAVSSDTLMPVQSLHLRAIEDLPTGRRNFSDYGPFRDKNIPVVFLSMGRTKHYHQVTDRPETLQYDKMAASVDVLDVLMQRLVGQTQSLSFTLDQPMHVADAQAGLVLHRAALGKQKGTPSSPELSPLLRFRVVSGLESLEKIVGTRAATDVLSEEEAKTVVRSSLRMQCILAPNSLMPPAACLLL